ncbi:MAG TPA: hypothetical protein VLE49_02455 [Anaerolineales bacterium]|nr:hypothetical protein [Anaerolineales bacterium]
MKIVWKCLLGLIIASQACVGMAPEVSTPDPHSIDTAIAGTMAAAATQTAQAWVTETPTSTAAPTKTLSATPFPTFTLVIAMPLVYVTKSTHCRSGPGEDYPSIVALKAGEAAQAVGRSRDAKYWIIRNPKRPSQLCWLSGKYASVTGVAGILSVFTAPPKPTRTRTPKPPTRVPTKKPVATVAPTFTASYSSTVNCTGSQWFAQIELANTGKVTFQSVFLIVEDTVTGDIFTSNSDDFINSNGCSSDTVDTLPPATTLKVSLPPLTKDPTGHLLNAGINLCTKPGGNGACAIRVITFTPAP